ncbi:MAG: hypothetical protein WDO69_05160 [Pseudomonadota bacterium]
MGLFAIAAPADAQDFSLVTTLVHPNLRVNNEDRFGSGVAISGGTLFVGARDEQAANAYSGVVHVFSDADWSEVAQLKSSVDTDIEFGAAVQLDGERALISNLALDDGVVWFFEKVAGVWTEKLRVQGLADEAFGYHLALRGDFAFIGVPRLGTGNVRVYRRVAGTWSEVQVLTASDAQVGDVFGFTIAFDGQRLAVAAPGGLQGQTRRGVYTFSLVGDAFVEDGKIAGDDPTVHRFAADVGVSGDTLIVNSPAANQLSNGGKALVYERHDDHWELDSELTVDNEGSVLEGLAMDHDTVWFGASTGDPRSEDVYAFRRANGGWQEAQKLSFPNLGEYELTSWTFQDGTFAIGFWNGLRTESVQVYRGAGYRSPSGGGATSGSAGAEASGGSGATGNTNAGGAPGEGTGGAGAAAAGTAAGVSSNSDTSGGAGAAANEGAAARSAASSGSSERGGCTLAQRSNAREWPLAALAFALAVIRKRRAGRAAITRTNS